MAVTETQYPTSPNHGIDWVQDTIKVGLLHGATFNAAHEYWSDVSGSEITGTNYTTGGKTLTITASYNSSTNTWTFTSADPTWSTATFTAGQAVLYKSTGTGSTSPLIGFVDFGGDQSPAAQDFVLHVSASGIATRQVIAAS